MKEKLERVTATVEVTVDRDTAFRIFTEEINEWWVRGPINFCDGARAAEIRFEPGVGGRFLEVYDDAAGDALEVGRITVWEPGRRLVYRSSLDDTEVDIRFEATSGGTKVLLEQRLVPGGENAHFLSGWENVLGWFGLRSRNRGRMSDFGEVALGDSVIILWPLEGASSEKQDCVMHAVYCYVDDLEGHFARAKAGGAVIVDQIRGHGDRVYVAEDLEGHRWTFAQARPTQK